MPLDDHFEALMDAADKQRPPPAAPRPVVTAQPFRALGHDRGVYYFWSGGPMQVVELKAKDLHSLPELNRLASLQWWESAYPGGKESFQVRAAGSALMDQCHALGIFDPDRLRGRGVWLDGGRVVAHLGDRLLVDGAETALDAMVSHSIYEQRRIIRMGTEGRKLTPLTDAEGKRIVDLCRTLAFDDPERDGSLLAGWIVCAMVAGGLVFRPHCWLTSEAGKGKTWVIEHIVQRILGELALWVQGSTTEPGVRGALRSDSLAVGFDEAETQNEEDRKRMQLVLQLARQATSGNNAPIAKGTQNGDAKMHRIRSCFILGSVNLALSQAADERRFLHLALNEGTAEQFAKVKAAHAAAMVPDVGARLFLRVLGLVPTIRANAEALAEAIGRTGASRATGDLLGVAMAGTLALQSSAVLTPQAADKLVARQAWVKATAAAREPEPEWRRALSHLMAHQMRFVVAGGRPDMGSVAELAAVVASPSDSSAPAQPRWPVQDAHDALKRIGLRIMHGEPGGKPAELRIANKSSALDDVFSRTPWAGAWRATLCRMPGVKRDELTRFHKLMPPTRAIVIPLRAIEMPGAEGVEPKGDDDVPII